MGTAFAYMEAVHQNTIMQTNEPGAGTRALACSLDVVVDNPGIIQAKFRVRTGSSKVKKGGRSGRKD